jgi:hypothetical protein
MQSPSRNVRSVPSSRLGRLPGPVRRPPGGAGTRPAGPRALAVRGQLNAAVAGFNAAIDVTERHRGGAGLTIICAAGRQLWRPPLPSLRRGAAAAESVAPGARCRPVRSFSGGQHAQSLLNSVSAFACGERVVDREEQPGEGPEAAWLPEVSAEGVWEGLLRCAVVFVQQDPPHVLRVCERTSRGSQLAQCR